METTADPVEAPPAASQPSAAQPAPRAADGPTLDARFSVPITIELEATTVPLARLQGMREGSVLPLDAGDGTIPVRILASGKPFARGTLVSVGDGYGVLIEGEAA